MYVRGRRAAEPEGMYLLENFVRAVWRPRLHHAEIAFIVVYYMEDLLTITAVSYSIYRLIISISKYTLLVHIYDRLFSVMWSMERGIALGWYLIIRLHLPLESTAESIWNYYLWYNKLSTTPVSSIGQGCKYGPYLQSLTDTSPSGDKTVITWILFKLINGVRWKQTDKVAECMRLYSKMVMPEWWGAPSG